MDNFKRVLAITIILSMLICSPAFSNEITLDMTDDSVVEIDKISEEEFKANVVDEEVDMIEESIMTDNKEDIVLKIDELNFYKPIELSYLGDDNYQIELADILFDYGEVKLHIVGDGDDIPFSKTVKIDEKITFVLKQDDYNCEILIINENEDRITFTGKIVEGKYELQWIDESKSRDISLQAIINESEPNDTMSQADYINDGDDVYGTMTADREDYYRVNITTVGRINFWLGQIPSGKNYNIYAYRGSSLIGSDTRVGLTQKLIQKDNQPMGTYYVRVSYPSGTLPTASEKYWLRVKAYPNLGWPVSNQNMAINACFGKCRVYWEEYERLHNGIDLNAALGTDVYSTGQGTVTYSNREMNTGNGTYGHFIDIVHTNENPRSTGDSNRYIKTRYAHLNDRSKYVGDTVSMGTKIGESGKSGYEVVGGVVNLNPYGAHLHYETLVGPSKTGSSWTRVQPLEYYPGKRCACGISFSSYNSDILNSSSIRNVGIYINDEFFIDIEAVLDMTKEELLRYGISKDKLAKFNELIKSDDELYENYYEDIGKHVKSYK